MVRHGGHLWREHPAVTSGDQLSRGDRAADVLKARFGSWGFLLVLNVIFCAEIGVHVATRGRWDPGLLLLNLFLSWLAAQQGGALQIASNRADRISAEVALHTQANTDELMQVNARQLEILGRLDGLDGTVAGLAQAVGVVMAARKDRDIPDLSGVLAEIRGLRALMTPAEPVPSAEEPQDAGKARAGKDTPMGMGSRLPKRGGGTGGRM